jgi:exocyst complex component 4
MSRKPSSSSKYKISAPQPMAQSGLESFGSDNGPYPSFAPRQPTGAPISNASRPSEYDASRSYSSDRIPSSSNRTDPPPSAGPMRPARSRMREAPENTSPGRPARAPRPLLTADTRLTSGSSGTRQGGHSPISPVSPEKPPPTKFNDPFAMDRSQRSELRDQYKMSERQASTPMTGSSSGTDKLRNVVGAFMAAGRQTEQPARRPGKSDARQKVARQNESWDANADGGKFGELDDVMRSIRSDWPFVTGSDFSASTLALSLLSPQSTSLPPHPSLSSFSKLHESLSAALQSSVQAHFQSFAASLPAHAQFLTTLSRAQDQVRTSKAALKEARDGFAGKGKSELAGVRARERTVRDMLKILDTM